MEQWIPKVGDRAAETLGRTLFVWHQQCAACGHYTSHHTRAFCDDAGREAEGTVCSGCGYVSKVSMLKWLPGDNLPDLEGRRAE